MIKLNATGHNAIYLDHSALINKSYNKYTDDHQKYQLQPHLFDFKPKLQKDLQETIPKQRKRKSKTTTNLSPETIELKLTCTNLLEKLKESGEDFKYFQQKYEESISRVWEEPTVFPQFHGANTRNDFQKFTLNNREYLIPPQSRFFNHDLVKLQEIKTCLDKYDFIVLDPPWKNKYIRRLKKAKQELGYKMLDNNLLSDIELTSVIHSNSIVAIWCTNSKQHQQRMLEEFFPRWDLKLIHKIVWLKLNTEGQLISEINEEGKKQPYEVLFIASHNDSTKDFKEIRKLEFILSVPKNPKSLELFARYLQPDFTSIGLEVLKLMDSRLYFEEETTNQAESGSS
ncbi:uncharacterized protein LOC129914236 [Episyrphus balteatus]|uniref:uncharacterized protein LOC129914236 n=1 Tax=Episyrphus balteatus TaxID=286459 RepID=UPI0024853898|nr:uncharacterized protein LOC129914236 [Episyrphus balteatus]